MKNLKIKVLTLGILATVVMSSTPAFAATNSGTNSPRTATKTVTTSNSKEANSVPTIPQTIKTDTFYTDTSWAGYTIGFFWYTEPSNGNTGYIPYLEEGCYDNLSSNTTSHWVYALQYYLNQADYSCTTDGIFGPNTRQQLINFQNSHGLTGDGVMGPATFSKLEQYN